MCIFKILSYAWFCNVCLVIRKVFEVANTITINSLAPLLNQNLKNDLKNEDIVAVHHNPIQFHQETFHQIPAAQR